MRTPLTSKHEHAYRYRFALRDADGALARFGGRVLIDVGLIAHPTRDVVHRRRHAVVSRSLAEWCAALDLTIGAGILLMLV